MGKCKIVCIMYNIHLNNFCEVLICIFRYGLFSARVTLMTGPIFLNGILNPGSELDLILRRVSGLGEGQSIGSLQG